MLIGVRGFVFPSAEMRTKGDESASGVCVCVCVCLLLLSICTAAIRCFVWGAECSRVCHWERTEGASCGGVQQRSAAWRRRGGAPGWKERLGVRLRAERCCSAWRMDPLYSISAFLQGERRERCKASTRTLQSDWREARKRCVELAVGARLQEGEGGEEERRRGVSTGRSMLSWCGVCVRCVRVETGCPRVQQGRRLCWVHLLAPCSTSMPLLSSSQLMLPPPSAVAIRPCGSHTSRSEGGACGCAGGCSWWRGG